MNVNAAQVHLLFNHLPLFLITCGFFILLVGQRRLNMNYQQLGLIFFVLAAVFTIPAQFSGEGAAHLLHKLDIVHDHDQIERHETLAFFSALLAYTMGVMAFISLIMLHNTHRIFQRLRQLLLILGAAGILLMVVTAHTGGEIRHTEIRPVTTD